MIQKLLSFFKKKTMLIGFVAFILEDKRKNYWE